MDIDNRPGSDSGPTSVGPLDPVSVRLPTPTPSEFRSSLVSLHDLASSNDMSSTAIATSASPRDVASGSTLPLSSAAIPNDSNIQEPLSREEKDGKGEMSQSLGPLNNEEEPGREVDRGINTDQPARPPSRRSIEILPLTDHTPTTPALPMEAHTRRSFSRSASPSPSINIQAHPHRRERPRPPITSRIRRALGIASPKASLTWRLAFGITQIVVICTLLGLASQPGSALPIPNKIDGFAMVAGKSQWEACQRPLGAWSVVWAVKALIGMGISVWEYWRAIRPTVDQLLGVERERLRGEARRAGRTRRHRPSNSGDANANGRGRRVSSPIVWTRGDAREQDLDVMDAAARGTPRSVRIVTRMADIRSRRAREERWYSRCTSFQALYGLVWFVTANILLYGSLDTCRYTSPYVWWLTFGLVCLGYIVVAEMLAVAIVVFVLGPLVYLTINIILVCLGRHPLQPGGRVGHINPDIPKMSRSMVERIPLVMYIPFPTKEEPTQSPPISPNGIQEEHIYPPAAPSPAKLKLDSTAPAPAPTRTRRRFFFFRKKKAAPETTETSKTTEGEDLDLEAGWERNEYPFVKLEANRAACAICLTDFEPPKRIGDKGKTKESEGEEKETNNVAEGSSGEAEPLRLLACGHVFHRECLDPWLVDVSGRCPTCQRPVEEEDLEPEEGSDKKKKKSSGRR
ncbi:hypothetical protein RhiJN_24449 [Ceratobasidium sp. AG-Ba]|nr:hypothetical protein RhiJN_24449 [Ceratobasidium sp. AG-Ba]